MAETVGTLIDKISIVELRAWHLREIIDNPEVSSDRRQESQQKLVVLMEQRQDLCDELSTLWQAICDGATAPKVYRQFKLYNDAELREASYGGPSRKTGGSRAA